MTLLHNTLFSELTKWLKENGLKLNSEKHNLFILKQCITDKFMSLTLSFMVMKFKESTRFLGLKVQQNLKLIYILQNLAKKLKI